MGAAENLAQEYEDKVPEEKMAELLGITKRALEAKRGRGQIPLGVWNKINSRIIYSRRKYDEWLENQWIYPPEWKFSANHSEFASPGTVSDGAKRSPIPRRRKGLKLHPNLEIK
ncbi:MULTISPECIES: hypothetical protein [Pseudomonas]|uniref:hypothetical protein n=1 Tax=Pseudomonas TaxID=286 RepID=UPI000AF17A5A|nr:MULTISPECIES: hypothetical protein [Pseudomonas]